jgi:TRAP-type C4-dicarboxylate transport system substrate-binding protein
MKKKGVLRLFGCICIMLVLIVTSLSVAYAQKAPEPIKLTMISAYPLTNITINYPCFLFKKYVEAWSGGRIIIDFKGGTEIVAFSEIPKVTERGMFDISFTAPPYVGSQYPAFSLFNFTNSVNQRICVRDDILWDLMNKITRNHGMVYLGVWQGDNPNFTLFTKKPPLDKDGKIESLRGLKVRTGGPFDADLVSDLGGTPVAMHPGEIYEALRTKLIDGTFSPMNNAVLSKYWELISYMTREGIYNFNAMGFMNANMFDKLSPENQKLIIEVAKEVQIVSYNYTGAMTWDGFSSEKAFAKVPVLSYNDKAKKTLAETRRKKLDKFAAAEPNLSKEIIEKFSKYFAQENLPIGTDASLIR